MHDFPPAWSPGRTYTFDVVLRHAGVGRTGFQAAARFAYGSDAGRDAGRFRAGAGAAVVSGLNAHVTYVQHAEEGTLPQWPDSARWRITWTAPDRGGRIVLHIAANAANNDDSPLGDFVYTATRTTEPAEKIAVRESSRPPTGRPAPSTRAPGRPRHRL